MRTSHAARLVFERAARASPGTRIMSPNAVKITFGSLRHGEAVVDAAHGEHADRAARTVDQFDVVGEQVLQAEAVDGVGVAAADLHEAVVPRRDRRGGGFRRGLVISSGSRNSSTNLMAIS